jgi:hypothetical protein
MQPQKDKNPILYWIVQRQQKKAAQASANRVVNAGC